MKIDSVILHRLEMPMREPFETSFGVEQDKALIVVEVHTKAGAVGFAECVAMGEPLYSEETCDTAWHMLRDFFIPRILHDEWVGVDDVRGTIDKLSPFKGNKMAKAALEMALWDAYAAESQTPLAELLGGVKNEIAVGISVGIQPSTKQLVEKVRGYLDQGFQRIKVKVKPGYDLEPLYALRDAFGNIPLMADANSAYALDDSGHLAKMDDLGLTMIEQPLAHDDMVDHARLQGMIKTPICLDESIHSQQDARKAIELGACQILNLKLGRVGGFSEALRIHQLCESANVPLWCGGMLETGIGRLHNIAITSLSGFTLPGDTAPSARYFEEDLINPPVSFSRPGFLSVEPFCGVGDRVVRDRLHKWSVATEEIKA